jgi:methylenetetrahydrofolate dehydrogenase (NADP+)/methenyltetrahydrofolate cyclohydrolase
MTTQIIDGKKVADGFLDELSAQLNGPLSALGRPPGLAVVLVGDNPASQAYVGMKKKACDRIGIRSFEYRIPAEVSQNELLDLLQGLNQNDAVDGILVQLPLPRHIEESVILSAIQPDKDVDGFHPENVGKLMLGLPTFAPCTPFGVCQLLIKTGLSVKGKHVVIVGRSHIVGKPLAALLLQKEAWGDATVTVCHSRSENLADLTRQADVVVAALGVPGFIKADMIRPGAVVIDVGISRITDVSGQSKLVGDVDYDSVFGKAGWVTPVPGGVGPMTIAMLMHNTVESFRIRMKVA